jgi:hypothetical protein
MQTHSMKRQIMRRVYYSYGLSIFTNIAFWQGALLMVSSALLARWLHVASIIDNFLAVPVRDVPHFISNSVFGAISHGEVLTVIVFIATCVIAASASRLLVGSVISQQRVT